MSRSEWVLRAAEALRQQAKKSGKLNAAERRAGVRPGYLRKLANRGFGRMPLGRFLSILEGIGGHPGEFFAEVFPPRGGQILAQLVDEPKSPVPRLVRKVRKRLAAEDFDGPIGADFLYQLDELRYDEPTNVAEKIEEAIGLIDWPHVPLALGVYASACRPLQRLDHGWHVLREGLGVAQRADQPLAIGDLIQRATFLCCESGDYSRALELNEQVLALYSRRIEINRLGRALADRGYVLGNLERLDEAAQAFRGALQLLDEDERRHRYSCHQSLVVIHSRIGTQAEALLEIEAATQLVASSYQRAKLDWSKAGVLLSMHRVEEGLSSFRFAFEALVGDPVSAALCHCDYVRALLELDRDAEAVVRSREARALLLPLEEESPIAAAAMRDLLLCEIEGERRLTLQLVDEVKRRIAETNESSTRLVRQTG